MAYEKIYTRVNWENEPITRTPINEDNLNNMDSAIDELDNRVVELSEYTPCIQEVEELPEQGVEKLIYQLPNGDIAIWNGSSFVQYQQKVIAGTNVSITNNVISATDTTYSALPNGGIDINENNQISVKAVNTILFEQDEDMSIEQTFDYTEAQFENHFKIAISVIDDAYNNRRLDSIMALVSVYGGVLDSYNEEHKITKLAIWDVGTGYMYWLRFDKFEMYFETTVSGSTITRVAGYVKTTGTNTVYGDGLQATVSSGTTTVKVKAKTLGGIKVQSIGISVNHDDSLKVAAVTTDYKLGVADTLLIRGSASGSVASISDGGANMSLKSCMVAIEPVQSGSGDPSPSNVRPITGWTECNVSVCGKNLYFEKIENASITSTGTFESNSSNDVLIARVNEGDTYTFLCNNSGITLGGLFAEKPTMASVTYNQARLYLSGITSYTVTIPQGVKYIAVRYLKTFTNYIIEQGSTATDYEPYKGNTYNIEFPSEAGTVYGGTLDVTNGVLTVDRLKIEYDGSSDENWSLWSQPTFNQFYIPLDNIVNSADGIPHAISNRFKAISINQRASILDGVFTGATTIAFNPSTITTVADWRTYLQNNSVTVVYELATPITYNLTPTEVKTLLGINNIFADTGDVLNAEYTRDATMCINNILASLS